MSKSIYVPKGQECRMANLVCDNLVVNGSLHVDGDIRVKHIRGNGFISASAVFAKTITFNTLDVGLIATGRLIAVHVTAVDIHAEHGMSVSLFTKAISVKAGKIMITEAEIENMDAGTILPPRRGGGFARRAVSAVLAMRIARLCRLSQKYTMAENAVDIKEKASGTDINADEARNLLDDPEFLRLRAMYKLTQVTGDIWQLVPKTEPTDRAVTLSERFTTSFDNAA